MSQLLMGASKVANNVDVCCVLTSQFEFFYDWDSLQDTEEDVFESTLVGQMHAGTF